MEFLIAAFLPASPFIPTSPFINLGDFLLFWSKFASLPVYSALTFYLKLGGVFELKHKPRLSKTV